MNQLKKYAGIIWILLGPVAMYYLVETAAAQIVSKPGIDN